MSRWYKIKELKEDTIIGVSLSGYTNDELSLRWIEHFEMQLRKYRQGHYYAKAVETTVRDGCASILKLEFLGFIQEVRKQAFKVTTITSAFRHTGIHPFNPDVVLQKVVQRQGNNGPEVHTPQQQDSDGHQSSLKSTPRTYWKLKKVGEKRLSNQQDELIEEMARFIRGALTQSAELVQTRDDLSRTRLADQVRRARRVEKNRKLQTGG
ncbi:hypothetical protein LY78DRAFT_622073, partial [Colletotrichum sublineola]